jgi:hypothetical protein
MFDMDQEDRQARWTRLLEHAGTGLCGILVGGTVVLMCLGFIGGPLLDSIHLAPPVVPGLLFANPLVFSAVFAASAVGSVIVARVLFERRTVSAAISAAIGLVAVMGLAVVAVSSTNVILMVVRAVA